MAEEKNMLPMFTTDMFQSFRMALEEDVLVRDLGPKLRLEDLRALLVR